MLRSFCLKAASIALVTILAFTSQQAGAQVKPFKVKGDGNTPTGLSLEPKDFGPYMASGTATYLGKYDGLGIAAITAYDEEPELPGAIFTGKFTGGFVFAAANGDLLVCEHPGSFGVFPDGGKVFIVFDADFTPTTLTIGETDYVSTGRFAGIKGSFNMIAVTESFPLDLTASSTPAFDFKWSGEGSFLFKK